MNETPASRGSRIRLRKAEFERLTKLRGWERDSDRAKHIGVSKSTMHRILRGTDAPGARFIDLSTEALGVPFEVLFEREEAA